MDKLFCLGMLLIPFCSALLTLRMKNRRSMNVLLVAALVLTLVCTVGLVSTGVRTVFSVAMGKPVTLTSAPTVDWTLNFSIGFDECGRIFGVLFAAIFLLAGVFSLEYMDHDHAPGRYNAFYLLTLFAMMGLSLSRTMLTYYMFYELMTVLSFPLVIHEGTKGAMKAGFKYLGYSLFGAALALFGFFCMGVFCAGTDFTAGGLLNGEANPAMVLVGTFCLLLGFGCKAGIMPLHFWLPTAHPVAPAPASAVLSATITKAGVLGIIRVLYYVVGPEAVRGTWVQAVMLVLALCTVFSGSMLAYKEKLMKRRFAWSTVSQVSYVLYGLFLLTPGGLAGGMMQVVFHAVCKTALFLTAGAIIHHTGCTYVSELDGVGRRMPLLMVCYTLSSLSLIGIPPFAGFVSKWQLATSGIAAFPVLGIVGAVVLLTSAILTAGYLLPITINGYFKHGKNEERLHPTWRMTLPLLILSGALLLLGLFPHGLNAAAQVMIQAVANY